MATHRTRAILSRQNLACVRAIQFENSYNWQAVAQRAAPFGSEAVMKDSSNIGSAEISRRTLLAGGIAVGAAPLLFATKASATVKVSQAAVHFRTAANTDHNCGACKHFLAPSSCRFVEGSISSDCSCWIWTSKIG
jgi:hypothetical protein